MLITGGDGYYIIRSIGAFHADHVQVTIITEVPRFGRFLNPGIPYYGRVTTLLANDDLAVKTRVFYVAVCRRVEVNAIGFTVKCYRACLVFSFVTIHLVNERTLFQADDVFFGFGHLLDASSLGRLIAVRTTEAVLLGSDHLAGKQPTMFRTPVRFHADHSLCQEVRERFIRLD